MLRKQPLLNGFMALIQIALLPVGPTLTSKHSLLWHAFHNALPVKGQTFKRILKTLSHMCIKMVQHCIQIIALG